MAAHQAPPSLRFSRQEHWSGLPFPSPMHESEKWKWSHSVVSNSSRPHGLQPTRLLCPWDFPGKRTGVGCHRLVHGLHWASLLELCILWFWTMCDDYSITQNSFNALRILCALPIYPSSTPHLTPSNHWSFLFLKNSYLFGCAGS